MSKRIGIDVDGVLSNFNYNYAKILTELSGIPFPDFRTCEPNTWFYDRAAGVSKAVETAAWDKIKSNDYFWMDLLAYSGVPEFLWKLAMTADHQDIYFITNRMGSRALHQTRLWLKWHGWSDPDCNVLLSGKKGAAAVALDLDVYLDDKTENCEDVVRESPKTSCFMYAKPYNRDIQGCTRVFTLNEFAEKAGLWVN